MTATLRSPTRSSALRSAWAVCLALCAGCAEDLSMGDGDGDGAETAAGETDDERPVGGPNVEHEDRGDRLHTHVDATDASKWIWLDLESGEELVVGDPMNDARWDLGFSRFNVRINGGVSGRAGMEATYVEDTTLDRVTVVPTEGWTADTLDEEDNVAYAFDEWYDYDISTHVLTPWPRVYVVRTGDGNHFKISIAGYYSSAGTSGHMQFEWAELEGGSP